MFKILLFVSVMLPTLIVSCPYGCRCDDIRLTAKCVGRDLTAIPTYLDPLLKELTLEDSETKSIETELQFYPNLEKLDLTSNKITEFAENTFQHQKVIKSLSLRENKFKEIKAQTFHGMGSLLKLDLYGNFIDQIDPNSFASLVSLEELNLGGNQIAEIQPDVFSGLSQLKNLYLNKNLLSRVPTESFLPFENLKELYISGNSFTTVEKAFEGLKKLETLNLKDVKLQDISSGAFAGLENLKLLDLSSNQLTRIPTKEMSNLHNLEKLNIAKNNFEAIEAGAFEGLTNLEKLIVIEATKLVRIDNDAFSGNQKLEYIDFEWCKALSQVKPTAFRGLLNLKTLYLRDTAVDFSQDRDEWCTPRLQNLFSKMFREKMCNPSR